MNTTTKPQEHQMYYQLTVQHTHTGTIRVVTLEVADLDEAREQMDYLTTPRWVPVSMIEVTAEQVAAKEAAENAAYAAAGYRVV